MDILVDLIIYLVRKFAESKPSQVRPPTPQELAAHQAAMKQRLEAMQKALAAQQARTQLRRKPKAVAKQAAPAKVSLSQPPAQWTTAPAPAASVPPVQTVGKPASPLPGLKIPLILGEILAPPVALREE
jgi:hypothetical protein